MWSHIWWGGGLQSCCVRACRVLSQLLLVLDDVELYELQAPLKLGQARAIVTSLNSLVYHSLVYPPKNEGRGGQPASGGSHLVSA